MQKYVFVSGGVLSGLGKGITTASIALLLKSQGLKVTVVKCDMYLNIDAGTMNPIEHGEVFVTYDGVETDQDIGHYERFTNLTLSRVNYITAGQVYESVLKKERALFYQGACVDAYNTIPDVIIEKIEFAGKKNNAEVTVVELGGTVGEYQNVLFFEAVRRMQFTSPNNVVLVHVGYLPIPAHLGEMKTKPLQQSVLELHRLGLTPDFIVGRSEKPIDKKRKEKIGFASGLSASDIFSNQDVDSVYKIPMLLDDQGLTKRIMEKLDIPFKDKDLKEWRKLVKSVESATKKVIIGIIGKYFKSGDFCLEDSYVCVIEAIKHAAYQLGVKPVIKWFDSSVFEKMGESEIEKTLTGVDGIIVPQGWGSRGTEGKILAAGFAREKRVPYLGLCFGMQLAVIEFARNVCGLKRANSTEIDPKTPYPVIHIMPNQKEYLEKHKYGGTIRLGAWDCVLSRDTIISKAYGKSLVHERHRHRYEVNNEFVETFKKHGLKIAGTSPDKKLVEAIEISDHPFFVGTQFHPEYQSTLMEPHPIFVAFLKAALGSTGK